MYPIEPEDKALNLSPKGFASYCYVYMAGGDQPIGNLNPTRVKYNTVFTDTLGEFDTTPFIWSFTPRRAGIYHIVAQVTVRQSAGGGPCDLAIYTVATYISRFFSHITANEIVSLIADVITPLTPADNIWGEFTQATGGPKGLYAALETSYICIKKVL
jgi:hypothetical protein